MKLVRLALIAALGIGSVPLASTESSAQPASDPVKDVARQRFLDGVKAFDAGRFEEARTAFEQAYTLSKSSAVLLNLGLAETKTNRCVAGGNHLSQFLRDHKEATPEQKSTAATAIEDCKKKAALVAISVDAPGADVTIDGASVGKSPLVDAVFVEPGTHTVIANLDGRTASATVDAKKGQTANATLAVKPPEPVGPAPGTTPSPGPALPAPGVNPDPYAPPGGQQPPAADTGGREDFGSWVMRKPLAWVGTGLFAVGLGLGIGFSVAASSSASDAELLVGQLEDQAQADGVQGRPCGPEGGSGGGDVYPSQCNQLRDALGVHDANVAVAVVGWVVAGLAAGGTVTYVMLDWYNGEKPKDEVAKPTVTAVPILTQDVQGIAVVGRF